jgi:hypothetical protein
MARGKLSGAKIKEVLEKMGVNIQETVTPILEAGAQEIIADANSKIHSITGNLAASGHVEEKKRPNCLTVKIVYDAKADDGYEYARINEYHHEKPLLYPAYDEHRDEIREQALDAIRKAVKSNAMP